MKKPVCTIIIVTVNVVIFFILSFLGMTESPEFMLEHGAMYVPYVLDGGEYYRIVTCIFLHFSFEHLMNNMILLFFIGRSLEAEIGKVKFLVIYFVGGIGGNLLSMWQDMHMEYYAVSAGASGAVFGLIGAMLYIAIRNRGQVGNLSGRGLIFMAVLSLYYGFTSSGVDNYAHIGGLLSGMLIAVLLYRKREGKRSEDSRI